MRRLRGYIIVVILGLAMVFNPGQAQSSDSETEPVRPIMTDNDTLGVSLYLSQLQSRNRVWAQASDSIKRPPSLDLGNETQKASQPQNPKSPLKAFLYSAVVPGAGQWYTGSKTKAAVFFSIEVMAWTGHIIYDGKGDDRTDEYEKFADTYWSRDGYETFLDYNWGVRDDDSARDQWGNLIFTHHLPDTRTQQYYEMIGKYDQFVAGWNDIEDSLPFSNIRSANSANREHYENLRHKANNMYDRATTSLIVSMANHLISGVEAALAARRHNNRAAVDTRKLSFRAETARINDEYFPMLTMTYRF